MAVQTIEGILNFSNVTKTDVWNGQDTGKYNVTVTMEEEDANKLSAMGVKIKDYQGNKQRKFQSKYEVTVVDADGEKFNGEIPYNSKVRVRFKTGPEHPVHGVSTYLDAVKVLEEAIMEEGEYASDF